MTTSVNRSHLDTLLAQEKGPCVSILLPTHRSGKEILQAKIRLKNSLRDAEAQLAHSQCDREEIDSILAPGHDLLNREEPWAHLEDGLAVYLGPGFDLHFTLPAAIEPIAVTGARFHVVPLITMIEQPADFLILAVSQKQVRLLRADRFSTEELPLGSIPATLTEVVGEDWKETSLQSHSSGSTGTGAAFHGQGSVADDSKKELERFCQRIDAGLRERFADGSLPLVVAAVDYVDAMFRHLSHYPQLLDSGIIGNPEHVSGDELRQRAWPLVERRLLDKLEDELARCRGLLGTGKASTDLGEILPAAFDGRVETLFITDQARFWGRFDPSDRRLEMGDEQAGGEELLNLATLLTKQASGTVRTVAREALPEEATVAAVFRY